MYLLLATCTELTSLAAGGPAIWLLWHLWWLPSGRGLSWQTWMQLCLGNNMQFFRRTRLYYIEKQLQCMNSDLLVQKLTAHQTPHRDILKSHNITFEGNRVSNKIAKPSLSVSLTVVKKINLSIYQSIISNPFMRIPPAHHQFIECVNTPRLCSP